MGIFSSFKTWSIVHIFFAFVFVVSGLILCFFMLMASVFVWPWDRTLYRKIVVNLAYMHWSQLVAVAQWWAKAETVLYMENPDDIKHLGHEHSIVVMNHKYDIEWLGAWMLAERLGMLGGTKIYGKSSLRFVPLIGWIWLFTESIFLQRDWEKDKSILAKSLKNICDYPVSHPVSVLLFPEGTRFTPEKHVASMKVAKDKGLPELKHHLLPRTKGFVHTMFAIQGKIPTILDLTVGFSDRGTSKLLDVVNGKPFYAEFYVRRIPTNSVPLDSEDKCAKWLHNHFQEKDNIYDQFQQSNNYTIGHRRIVPRRIKDLVCWLFWMILIGVPFLYYLAVAFISGSFLFKVVMAAILLGMNVAMRKMISVSDVDHSSSKYGVRNNNKRD